MERRTLRRIFGLLAVALLVTGGPLASQGNPSSMRGGQGPPSAMMRGTPMPGPAMMLAQREALGLTDVQVQRLELLAAGQEQSMRQLMPQAMRAMADLMEAATGSIDVESARTAHDRMARVHGDMLVANLEALKEARGLLTPDQRTRWDALVAEMGGMMRMVGPMMMGPMGMGAM